MRELNPTREINLIAVFNNQKVSKNIASVHEEVRDHTCNHCGNSFSSVQYLKTHVQAVHEGVRHTCKICKLSFSHERSLKRHAKSMHDWSDFFIH